MLFILGTLYLYVGVLRFATGWGMWLTYSSLYHHAALFWWKQILKSWFWFLSEFPISTDSTGDLGRSLAKLAWCVFNWQCDFRRVLLYSNMLNSKLRFSELFSKSHANLSCVNLHTSFHIWSIRTTCDYRKYPCIMYNAHLHIMHIPTFKPQMWYFSTYPHKYKYIYPHIMCSLSFDFKILFKKSAHYTWVFTVHVRFRIKREAPVTIQLFLPGILVQTCWVATSVNKSAALSYCFSVQSCGQKLRCRNRNGNSLTLGNLMKLEAAL